MYIFLLISFLILYVSQLLVPLMDIAFVCRPCYALCFYLNICLTSFSAVFLSQVNFVFTSLLVTFTTRSLMVLCGGTGPAQKADAAVQALCDEVRDSAEAMAQGKHGWNGKFTKFKAHSYKGQVRQGS